MSQTKGAHSICIRCPGSSWFQQTALKWELSIELGDTEMKPATRGDLDGVENAVWSAIARAEAMFAENEYEKTTETEFRNASERVNSHTVGVSIFIVIIEVVLCSWQVSHLWTFFKREKLEP
eukprot:CAMPEP_0194518484 /NCGR_PEP_ID=MMETSP0253-20130528/51917_1 /TAXON_ID=2966 /ORGANISM="Noctiluca scintillans" /LENGTH=121 /DNA_ID=CAMNT_0039362531 /DNA_START=324 /DNA_END=689 /DNA_ORIENTATION=-